MSSAQNKNIHNGINFKDSSTTDKDVGASVTVAATDTGSGTEDVDITIAQQIAGTSTNVVVIDADGNTQLNNHPVQIKNTTSAELYFKDDDCTDDDVNVSITVNATATGSGAENADISIKQQISGTLTEVMLVDADGALEIYKDTTIKHATLPTLQFKDDQATDDDVNASISVNLTDTGSSAEDADISIKQQIAGTLTEVVAIDADGDILFPNKNLIIKHASAPALYFKDDNATDDDVNVQIDVNLTDTGSGAEDADISIKQQIAGTLTEIALIDADNRFKIYKTVDVLSPGDGYYSPAYFAITSYGSLNHNGGSGTMVLSTDTGAGAITKPLIVTTGLVSSGAFDSGALTLRTGTSTQNTGITTVSSGNASGGNSGNVALTTGTATGTRGSVTADANGADFLTNTFALRGATPAINIKDTSCSDTDINASIEVNATDTGSGVEDIDISIKQQINGTLTEVITVDADGELQLKKHTSIKTGQELRFYDADESNYVGFEAPALAADKIWVLPTADGSAGTALTTNGSGTLLWSTTSQVICDDGNAHGAVNTKIRRFVNSATTGTDITYADSANDGGSFTINTAGLYSISYTDFASVAGYHGISINSAQLTTNIETITTANRLVLTSSTYQGNVSTVYRAAAADVIRCHTDGGPNDTTPTAQFRIVRIG